MLNLPTKRILKLQNFNRAMSGLKARGLNLSKKRPLMARRIANSAVSSAVFTIGNDNGVSSNSHIVAMPAIASGYRLVIFIGASTSTWTFPAGFTEIFDAGTSGQALIGVAYRDCDGSGSDPGATITVTSGSSRAAAWAVARLAPGTFAPGVPPEVAPSVGTGNDAAPDCGAITVSWGVAARTLYIAAATMKEAPGVAAVLTYPAGYVDNRTLSFADSTALVAICSKAELTAPENPGTYLMSVSRQWAAVTVACKLP